MKDAARRILYIIAPERFRDEELAEPRRALEAAGHHVTIASTRAGEATGMLGARIRPDATIAMVSGDDFDCLAIAGGAGAPQHLWDSAPLAALVALGYAAGKTLAAICLAPPVLARAGVLAGRRATTFPSARALIELRRGGATYVRESVVRDGTILTASGPEASEAFGAALVQLVES